MIEKDNKKRHSVLVESGLDDAHACDARQID